MQNPKLDRFLRIPEICEALGGVHPCTVYRHAGKDGFPPLREIFPNVSGMLESEFLAYQETRPLRQEKPARKALRAISARKAQRAAADAPRRDRKVRP